MKDLLVLLLLLSAQTTMVYSQPYPPDEGNCRDPDGDYLSDKTNLCCKRCPPGQKLKHECSETNNTVCEPCPKDQYMEGRNYSPNCRSCTRCRKEKGLQHAKACSAVENAKCECRSGMYCSMGYVESYCEECSSYRICKVGFGVSKPGTATSNVRCEPCPHGTFSNTASYTDPCWPHTNCHGRAVILKGNATADTVCAPEAPISRGPHILTTKTHGEMVFTTTASTTLTTVATTDLKAPRGMTDSTMSTALSDSEEVFNQSTKSLPKTPDSTLVAVITSITGFILLFIAIMLVRLCRAVRKKGADTFHPKVDANGNCEAVDETKEGYLGETQLTSFTVVSPEQQCLLERGEGCSDQSQSSSNTESLTRTDGCSSEESFGPPQSTVCLNTPHSALSEPLPLLSNTEPDTSQTSIPSQGSLQPTVTTSPQVNVNITFNIGNGSTGAPCVMPTDFIQADCKLPYGEEEESFSIPQQEDGKTTLTSVQESETYSL